CSSTPGSAGRGWSRGMSNHPPVRDRFKTLEVLRTPLRRLQAVSQAGDVAGVVLERVIGRGGIVIPFNLELGKQPLGQFGMHADIGIDDKIVDVLNAGIVGQVVEQAYVWI